MVGHVEGYVVGALVETDVLDGEAVRRHVDIGFARMAFHGKILVVVEKEIEVVGRVIVVVKFAVECYGLAPHSSPCIVERYSVGHYRAFQAERFER